MFAYEPPLEPYVDEWNEYICPRLCQIRVEEVCKDIFMRGENSTHKAIYDAIYELVLADIEYEHMNQE